MMTPGAVLAESLAAWSAWEGERAWDPRSPQPLVPGGPLWNCYGERRSMMTLDCALSEGKGAGRAPVVGGESTNRRRDDPLVPSADETFVMAIVGTVEEGTRSAIIADPMRCCFGDLARGAHWSFSAKHLTPILPRRGNYRETQSGRPRCDKSRARSPDEHINQPPLPQHP